MFKNILILIIFILYIKNSICEIKVTIFDEYQNDKIKVITEGFKENIIIDEFFLLNYGISKDVIKNCMKEIKGEKFYSIIDKIFFKETSYSHFYEHDTIPLSLKITANVIENYKKPIREIGDKFYFHNNFPDRNVTFDKTITTVIETSYTTKSSNDSENGIELNLNIKKAGSIKYSYKYKYGTGNDNSTKKIITNNARVQSIAFPNEKIIVITESYKIIIFTKLLLKFRLTNFIEIDLSEPWYDEEVGESHYYWFYPIDRIFEKCNYFHNINKVLKSYWIFTNMEDSHPRITTYSCNKNPEKCPEYYYK